MVYKLYGSISSIRKLKDVIQKGNLNNTKLHILHLLANTTKRENTIENTIEQFIAAKEVNLSFSLSIYILSLSIYIYTLSLYIYILSLSIYIYIYNYKYI